MSQRQSGYVRKELDAYETPEWVTAALVPHIPEFINTIWEPACGSGKMVRALTAAGFNVVGSDISGGINFLTCDPYQAQSIITNPPYSLASEFILRAIKQCEFVAMLLRTDFDHARSRLHLFQRPQFSKKIILTRRIRWIEGSTGSPSFNHAWFCWSRSHMGPPTLAYHQ